MNHELEAGYLKRIHINQHNIKHNAKHTTTVPRHVVTIKCSNTNYKCDKVSIDGPSELVYSPNKPLACGAKVWIETTAKVVPSDEN